MHNTSLESSEPLRAPVERGNAANALLHRGSYWRFPVKNTFTNLMTALALAMFTLTLQKSRMLQIQGGKGEAVVDYCEPLTTLEMRYHRLSRRVNNTASFQFPLDLTVGGIHDGAQE